MDFIKTNNHLVNTLLFPGSIMISSYDTETFVNNYSSDHDLDFDPDELQLLYIPFTSTKLLNVCNVPKYIPCLLKIARKNAGNVMVIHMHGNACDLNHISMCATRESYSLNCHYLIVEYPQYGISAGSPSESVIDEILYAVYDFVINQLRVPTHKVVLIGRSIGTGPVTKLAAVLQIEKRPVAAVILQSPYTSLRNAASDLVGTCISSSCMIERWENWKLLCRDQSSLACPVLLIHADQDQIIDAYHSEIMHAARLKLGLPSTLYIQKSTYDFVKNHNQYDYDTDVIIPSRDFLAKYVPFSGLWPLNLDQVKQYIIRPYDFPKFNMNKTKIWTIANCIRWSYCPCIACCESMIALTCNICNNCDNNDGFQYQPKSQRKINKEYPLINTEKVKRLIKKGSIRSKDVDKNKEERATINPILHETIIFDNDKKSGGAVVDIS